MFSLVGVNVLLPGTLASSLHVRRSIDPNGLFTLPDLNSNSNYDANRMAVGSLVECEWTLTWNLSLLSPCSRFRRCESIIISCWLSPVRVFMEARNSSKKFATYCFWDGITYIINTTGQFSNHNVSLCHWQCSVCLFQIIINTNFQEE